METITEVINEIVANQKLDLFNKLTEAGTPREDAWALAVWGDDDVYDILDDVVNFPSFEVPALV